MIFFIKFRQFALLVFVFIFCYAVYNPFGEDSFFTLSNVVGSVYLFSAILTFKSRISYKEIAPFIIPILVLFVLITIMSVIYGTPDNIYRHKFNFGLFRNILLFILIFYDLKGNRKLQQKVQNVFLVSVSSVAVLVVLDVGVISNYGRIKIFGTNANELAFWAVLGICFILDKVILKYKSNRKRLLLLLIIPLLLYLIARTGSRGAIIYLIAAIITFLYYSARDLRSKLNNLFLAFFLSTLILLVLLQNEVIFNRLLSSIVTGNTGGRMELWGYAFKIIGENLIFGIGETGYELRIIELAGKFVGPHNVFIYVIAISGITGFFLITVFLINLYNAVISSYNRLNQVLPIVLFLIVFLQMMKGGGILLDRVLWFLFAYIAASTTLNKSNLNQC